MTEPIPDDSLQRRTWLIGGVLALVVLLVGIGLVFAVMAMRKPQTKPPVSYTPAQPTTSTITATQTTSAPATSAPASATAGGAGSAPVAGSGSSAGVRSGTSRRAALIAYRLDGRVWVAGESGSPARVVANSAQGAFSLSPDGKTLALMQGPTDSAYPVLITVATGVQTPLRKGVDLPVWSPDSSWVAYTTGTSSKTHTVRRANRDGSADALLISSAAAPCISADGKQVAYTRRLPAEGATQPVQVFDLATGTSKTVADSLGATSFSFASNGVLYFAKSRGDRSLWMSGGGLSASSAIASMPAGTDQQAPGDLFPSPDGLLVLFAMTGDDGYSRIVMASVAAKQLKLITMLKDATPDGWTADGTGVFYIFGNAFQNESTSLYRMDPDGTHRRVVVSGASL